VCVIERYVKRDRVAQTMTVIKPTASYLSFHRTYSGRVFFEHCEITNLNHRFNSIFFAARGPRDQSHAHGTTDRVAASGRRHARTERGRVSAPPDDGRAAQIRAKIDIATATATAAESQSATAAATILFAAPRRPQTTHTNAAATTVALFWRCRARQWKRSPTGHAAVCE
jgi:hypothetical protein